MNVADVLRGAAGEIEKRGLYKGGDAYDRPVTDDEARADETVRCCTIGAMQIVDCVQTAKAMGYLYAHLGIAGIGAWNDAPGRTQDEVVSTLRAAADQWEADNGVA